MGLGTLVQKIGSVIITNDWYNDFLNALGGDFVGRNTTGAPTAGKNLGTTLYPWGNAYIETLFLDGESVDFESQESQPYKISSGKTRSGSNQPAFLVPNGAAATAVLDADPTPLVLEINGEAVTISSDVSMTGLTVAPSSNNTCLVNVSGLAGSMASRLYGEYNPRFNGTPTLVVDNMGTSITAKIGQYAAFKVVSGANTEYFIAFIESATALTDIRRGYFYDSSSAPINRIAITDNDTITLMSLAIVFAKSDGTLDVHYKNPTYSPSEPAGPASNDYWFDLTNRLWKQYDGAAWNTVERIPIGLLVIDSSNCVAARSFDFFASMKSVNTLDLEYKSATVVRATSFFSTVGVLGVTHRYGLSRPTWDIASHLAAAADLYTSTEQASRTYYLYVSDTGISKISDIHPYWRPDLLGWYHPHNPWRFVGSVENDGSSNFISASVGSERLWSPVVSNHIRSSSSGSFVGSGSSDPVTNLTGTITLLADNPVEITLESACDPTTPSRIVANLTSGTNVLYWIYIKRNGTIISKEAIGVLAGGNGANQLVISIPTSSVRKKDRPGAGTHVYTVEYERSAGNNINFTEVILSLREEKN